MRNFTILAVSFFFLPFTALGAVEFSDGSVIGLWHLNGDAVDASGNGYNGTAVGASWNTGKLGNAFFSNGSNSNIYITSTSSLRMTDSTFSVSFWHYGDINDSAFNSFVNQWNYPEGRRQWTFDNSITAGGAIGNDNMCFSISPDGSGPNTNPMCYGSFPTSGWNHVVGTYDGTTRKLYVNNSLVASSTASSMYLTPGTYTSFSGQGGNPAVSGWINNGNALDEIVIFNDVLTSDEVASLYASGSGAEVCVSVGCGSSGTDSGTIDFENTGFYSTCETVEGTTSTIKRCYNPVIPYAVILSMILGGGGLVYGINKFIF